MSVDYNAKVYYGYEVHYDEVIKLSEHEKNYLEDNNLIHIFNNYDEPTWLVIGFQLDWATAGDFGSFRDMLHNFNRPYVQKQRNELDNFFKLTFKDRADNKPDFYFGCEIS